jgi:signal transduction histidine kinase
MRGTATADPAVAGLSIGAACKSTGDAAIASRAFSLYIAAIGNSPRMRSMKLDAETIGASWRSWWSTWRIRDRCGPPWLQLVWTFLFNSAIAVGLTLIAWGFARRVDVVETLRWNFVVAQCIGFSIHGLFSLALALLGAGRIEGFKGIVRVAFYSGIPITGVFIGYGIGLSILGVDVPKLVVERPNILVAIVLLSVLMSAFWYRHMANKTRLAEAEAERERQQARANALERHAMAARLQALQAQIEPHFLFNTLANVSSLIDAQPRLARQMLERLIDLLRASLTASREEQATLGQEAELLRAYLEILQLRMGPRLAFEIDIPAALRGERLPPLTLQPLVENAIKHGVEPKLEGGRVTIGARATANHLEITVSDNGLGFSPHADSGVGLTNLRERIFALHGESARMKIEDAEPGTRVRLLLPHSP